MIYASYSTGFRSGGFNSRGTTPNTVGPYESETVDTIELGLRSQFLDDRVTLNLTYFDSTYEDKQEAVVTAGDGSFIYNGQPEDCGGPTCTFIFNAGEVDNSGIEIEAMALVTEGLTLRAAIGTLDSEYAKFDYAGVDIADIANVTWAPELTAAVGAEWLLNIGAGQLALNANFKYTDEAWGRTDGPPMIPQPGPICWWTASRCSICRRPTPRPGSRHVDGSGLRYRRTGRRWPDCTALRRRCFCLRGHRAAQDPGCDHRLRILKPSGMRKPPSGGFLCSLLLVPHGSNCFTTARIVSGSSPGPVHRVIGLCHRQGCGTCAPEPLAPAAKRD